MLKQRILTSLVLAPAALALVFYTPLTLFSYIAAGIVLLGAWEWSAFMGLKKLPMRFGYVAFMAVLLCCLNFVWPIEQLWQNHHLAGDVNYVFTLSVAWWLVATCLVWSYPRAAKAWNKGIVMRAIAGVLTLVPLWLALNTLRSAEYQESTLHGSLLIMAVLGIVWSADIGAFFTGKNFGKHKLMPHVSPNKTIEGLAGGLVASVIFIVCFCYFADVPADKWLIYGFLTVFIALFSAIGDLLESMFKREAGLKDSGSCLPGHGGILDRIDSLTAAAPIFVACYAWALQI
ncbi:phosphatidate cytidylyltransferase [Pseudoalteromonas tunicata]|uniref:phosphatidate cytidylyltransferase n=1 Tax=Pseudoalteromonas tunicata TaxID=314281 RepID=UPI0005910892|nr:phosphatidate cytidylyltransferase [Pseudoalteromonas tunicata]ATC95375.1 phosphatidate cytidylyltransferase [Pseudoalteromonas tunicata]AXT30961.1 phosphatidate cytidylyltransferase [Pseudoalteromonas tunicata]MDP4984356.1 phosphatidate cytidylyltransferase [Pseudoalteromonas tunicata]MDP5213051.1 phosphatidate cytidylyltransferase [Pseudoalteromonas tunicata]